MDFSLPMYIPKLNCLHLANMPRIYLSIYLSVDPYPQKRKDCMESIDRSAARNFGSYCHARPTLSPESTIRP